MKVTKVLASTAEQHGLATCVGLLMEHVPARKKCDKDKNKSTKPPLTSLPPPVPKKMEMPKSHLRTLVLDVCTEEIGTAPIEVRNSGWPTERRLAWVYIQVTSSIRWQWSSSSRRQPQVRCRCLQRALRSISKRLAIDEEPSDSLNVLALSVASHAVNYTTSCNDRRVCTQNVSQLWTLSRHTASC